MGCGRPSGSSLLRAIGVLALAGLTLGCASDPDQPPPDPAEAGVTAWTGAEHTLLGPGDVQIPLSLFIPAGEDLRPVIVFSHGFALAPDFYTSYGEHLASWGFAVVMPQLPGSPFAPVSHRDLAAHLAAVLDWLEDGTSPLAGRVDVRRIGLAGHSMGGKISLLLASEDDRPRSVFGLDPVDSAAGPAGGDPQDYPSVTPERMDRILVPMGLLGETQNGACETPGCQACAPAEENFEQYFLHAKGPAWMAEVLGADHMSFLDDPDCPLLCDLCTPGTDDPAQSRMLARRYLTAFFLVTLQDEGAFSRYLTGPGMEADQRAGLVTFATKNGF